MRYSIKIRFVALHLHMLVMSVMHGLAVKQCSDPTLMNSLIQMLEDICNIFLAKSLIWLCKISRNDIRISI